MIITATNYGDIEVEIEFNSDIVDCYFQSGNVISSGRELTDDELNTLTEDYGDLIYDEYIQHSVGMAEYSQHDDR